MDVGKVAATIAQYRGRPGRLRDGGQGPCPPRRAQDLPADHRRHRLGVLLDQDLHQCGGPKVRVWGSETKPDRVILDPELTTSLPPELTPWTGLDAFVHALEASTNCASTPGTISTLTGRWA